MRVDDLRLERNHYVGAASELLAASFFIQRGYQVYTPVIQQSSVDFVIYKNGKYQSVQVKTASWSKSGRHKYLQCRIANTNKYSHGVFDIVAVIKDEDIWIIPREALESTNICLKGTITGYREEWKPYLHTLMDTNEWKP